MMRMRKKFDPHRQQALLSPEREALLRPQELLRTLGLKPGQTLADVGCGPGFFTLPAAEIVGPSGKVIAIDIQEDMLFTLRQRVHTAGLRQVEICKAPEQDPPLPAHNVDMVLLAFILHEMDQRSLYLHRLRQALRVGGRIVILEWEKRATDQGPPLEDRLSPEVVTADVQAAGFAIVEHRTLNPAHYAIIAAPL